MADDSENRIFIIGDGFGEECCVTELALSQLKDAGYLTDSGFITEKADWELMKAMVGEI